MEHSKENLNAMEHTQNPVEALSDEQLEAVAGGAPTHCEVCGSTNLVVRRVFGKSDAWFCDDCGEILQPYYLGNGRY